jgi:hypothetical protein
MSIRIALQGEDKKLVQAILDNVFSKYVQQYSKLTTDTFTVDVNASSVQDSLHTFEVGFLLLLSLPCLALPCPALPCLASPCLASLCLALPCLGPSCHVVVLSLSLSYLVMSFCFPCLAAGWHCHIAKRCPCTCLSGALGIVVCHLSFVICHFSFVICPLYLPESFLKTISDIIEICPLYLPESFLKTMSDISSKIVRYIFQSLFSKQCLIYHQNLSVISSRVFSQNNV